MVTKKYLLITLSAMIMMFTGFRCSNEIKMIENILEGDYINNCPDEIFDFGEMISMGDPSDRFFIQLPYNWDIRQSYSDSLYGVYASNYFSIPIPMEERLAISITAYASEKEMDEYFRDELIELAKGEDIKVIEKGQSMLTGNYCPWVLFEMPPDVFNMVYYFKNQENNEYYLIQTASYDTLNFRKKQCYLKQLVNTFELVKE
ncbi:MAG: hypothetical protein R2750_08090 [Bacteroidales bacterium]